MSISLKFRQKSKGLMLKEKILNSSISRH